MFPSEFFDDTPTLLTSFVIRNVNGFVSCIGFERSNRFSILEHQIRTAKAKFFLSVVREQHCQLQQQNSQIEAENASVDNLLIDDGTKVGHVSE